MESSIFLSSFFGCCLLVLLCSAVRMDGRPGTADQTGVSSTPNVWYLCCDVFADGVSLLCV